MKSVFMVAEKPSLAASLATILSNGKNSSKKGFNGACSVHEWNGTFLGSPARLKMTSVRGHVLGVDFSSKYNKWDRVDPVELFSCSIEKRKQCRSLKCLLFWPQKPTVLIILFCGSIAIKKVKIYVTK
ncbi:hypothetical protein HUJ04_009891 [Dendroctonus ponderosae]|nr:hypothetical protein HUJ04_009891 [Dendroctonus ponderosae]